MPKTQDAVLDVEELRNAAATVNAVARLLVELAAQKEAKEGAKEESPAAEKIPAEEIPTEETPVTEPPAPPLRLEDVRSVLAEKSRAGHTAEVRELLKRHGAERLSAVAPEEYPALMAEAEEIGNGD